MAKSRIGYIFKKKTSKLNKVDYEWMIEELFP